MKASIQAWLEQRRNEMEQTFRHLHNIAELSWQEKETTAFLHQQLKQMGVNTRTFGEQTGVVAEWVGPDSDGGNSAPGKGAGAGKAATGEDAVRKNVEATGEDAEKTAAATTTVALRADIDALWQNVGNEWKANHSCGHDGHMTVVLYALRCLREIGYEPPGRLIIIFQPAEETGGGAKKMIELGVLDEVDYLLGIHLRPIRELRFGQASSAIYHGAAVFLEGRLTGREAHASRPNEGINVIDALASIVHAVNAVKVDPTVPASCKVTKMTAGNQNVNIIPGAAEFAVDVRAQTNEAMDELLVKLDIAIRAAAKANGTELELHVSARMVAAVPNSDMEQVVGRAITDILGAEGWAKPPITPGGEDFHFYPLLKPSIQATMVGLGSDLVPGLHHPDMTFNLEALQVGAAILALAIVNIFEATSGEA